MRLTDVNWGMAAASFTVVILLGIMFVDCHIYM